MRTRVYVSGPYSSHPEWNTHVAIGVGQSLLRQGYAPMVPHLTHYWHEQYPNDWDTWMELDLPWVLAADAVYRIPGASKGADEECALAEAHGIPVFRNMDELCAAVPRNQGGKRVRSDDRVPPAVDAALDRIRDIFAKKNADYAEDRGSWRSNFRDVAQQMAITDLDACDTLIAVKQARLRALRANGRPPMNEATADTYLDRAVYAVIALAMLMEDEETL